MKRTIIILALVLIYVYGVSFVLMYSPIQETPSFLASIFAKKSHGYLAWLIIQQKIAVLLVGGVVAYILFRIDRKKVLSNAIAIGGVAVLWMIAYKGVFYCLNNLPFKNIGITDAWIECSDYLTVGVTIPVFAAIINRLSQRIQTP